MPPGTDHRHIPEIPGGWAAYLPVRAPMGGISPALGRSGGAGESRGNGGHPGQDEPGSGPGPPALLGEDVEALVVLGPALEDVCGWSVETRTSVPLERLRTAM